MLSLSLNIIWMEIINPLTSYDNTPRTKGEANQVENNPPHTGVVVFSNNVYTRNIHQVKKVIYIWCLGEAINVVRAACL